MKQLCMTFCLWAAFAGSSSDGLAAPWPKLSSAAATAPQCAEALQIADAAFHSDSFLLFDAPSVPAGLPSVFALRPQSVEASGGDGIEIDPATFEKLSTDGNETAFWQRDPLLGRRLVVLKKPVGWRGEWHSLFVLGADVRLDELLSDVRADRAPRKFSAVVADSWQPPLILREKDSGRPWFVDAGQPSQFLADWQVHAVGPDGARHCCTVQFRPSAAKAAALLPRPVQKLARLLDQTMGSGKDEGTLQPTARLRIAVEHMWANAALRPWASATPWNSREQVDAELKTWSEASAARRKVHQAILRQMPLAEQALAAYYEQHFGRPAGEARELAAYALDVAVRSHYVFPSRSGAVEDGAVRRNPWRRWQQQ